MASHNAEVLQEFLVSLGFVLDAAGERKFNGALGKVAKSTTAVSKNVLGVAVAAQAMVLAVTYEFERLYYASKKVNDSAGNLQSFTFGAGKIGIAAESATGALEAMAQSMKYNPAMLSFFETLTGKKASGGTVNNMITLLKELRKSEPMIQSGFAEQFGVDQGMLTLLMQPGALEKLEEAMGRNADMNKSLGIDTDKMAKDSMEFQNQFGDVTHNFFLLAALLSKELIPALRGMNSIVQDIVRHFTRSGQNPIQVDRQGRPLDPELRSSSPSNVRPIRRSSGNASLEAQAAETARRYGIPPAIFNALIGAESGWDPNAAAKGSSAKGLTQLLKGTAKDMGVDNAFDPTQNLEGGAKYLSQQYQRFGNWRDALSAYNQGPGNYQLGEGRKYADGILSKAGGAVTINASPTIMVSTKDDPVAVASGVGRALDRNQADVVRYASGAINQ